MDQFERKKRLVAGGGIPSLFNPVSPHASEVREVRDLLFRHSHDGLGGDHRDLPPENYTIG